MSEDLVRLIEDLGKDAANQRNLGVAMRADKLRQRHLRPLPPFNEDAFEDAKKVFHRVYFHSYKPVLPSEHDEAHAEALDEALGAFLGVYMERAS